jgi:hypothetical protein
MQRIEADSSAAQFHPLIGIGIPSLKPNAYCPVSVFRALERKAKYT